MEEVLKQFQTCALVYQEVDYGNCAKQCSKTERYLLPSGLNAKAFIGPKCPFTPPISSSKIFYSTKKIRQK